MPSGLPLLLKSMCSLRHQGVSRIWRSVTNLMSTEENHAPQQGGARKYSTGKSGVMEPVERHTTHWGKESAELFHPQILYVWKNYLLSMHVAHMRSQFFYHLCQSLSLKMSSWPTCVFLSQPSFMSFVNNFVLCEGWERQSDFNPSRVMTSW